MPRSRQTRSLPHCVGGGAAKRRREAAREAGRGAVAAFGLDESRLLAQAPPSDR